MKKALVFLVISALLIAVAGTAMAAKGEQVPIPNLAPEKVYSEQTAAKDEKVPTPELSDKDLYQQMYEACHGPNGYMSKYFGEGNVPQGYRGMMGGYGSNTNSNF
ncbi:hypothetical protein [Dehalobacterium formicoaceticum]|uniref:hypothetical protein n=1 Tax=Dehalobacterium formicoaceticum TaxID=51515 RepID=UPI000B7F72A3|nr:hypothetical protein [Dehalobacterium formicoaceticum]